jgi:hypothetical protein
MSLKDRGAIYQPVILLGFGTVKRVLLFLVPFMVKNFRLGKNSMMKSIIPYINKGWDLFKPKNTLSLEDNNP